MKKSLYKISFLLALVLTVFSCEENNIEQIDVRNARAIAGFSSPTSNTRIVFNPAENTENVITVGVTTISDQDRSVVVTLDADNSTLDPSYYEISTLNPVIPAGEFTTDIVITTLASTNVPDADSEIILNLESVEGAEITAGSIDELTVGLDVKCPSVDMQSIPGTYQITVDPFETYLGDGTFEVVAGPGENQFTLKNPFGHPTPEGGTYDVIIDVDPATGAVNVDKQAAWHCDNWGCSYGEGRVEGMGLALTCIGQINFSLKHTVNAGSFGTYPLTIVKQ